MKSDAEYFVELVKWINDNEVKCGSLVRVKRKPSIKFDDWNWKWDSSDCDKYIGKILSVYEADEYGIYLNTAGLYKLSFPFFILEAKEFTRYNKLKDLSFDDD